MPSNPSDRVDRVPGLKRDPITQPVKCLLCAGEADLCRSHCVGSKSQNSFAASISSTSWRGWLATQHQYEAEGRTQTDNVLNKKYDRHWRGNYFWARIRACASLHFSGEGQQQQQQAKVKWLATFQDCNSNLIKVSGSAGGGLSLTCNRQKTELVSRLLLLQKIALKFTFLWWEQHWRWGDDWKNRENIVGGLIGKLYSHPVE